jgi:predicted acyltransferase
VESQQIPESPVVKPISTQRVRSLDALRGFDMFWIIGGWWIFQGLGKALNNPWYNKHIIPQLDHPPWEGFTAWDVIMPLFLFIVGAAMPFAFAKRLAQRSKKRLYFHIIIRTIILFILGMVAQGHLLEYDLEKLHLFSNTLQAIAVGYLVASILYLQFRLRWQIVITVGLLLLFWGLMMLVPVPGHGAVLLKPESNLAIYLDHTILGKFQDGTTYTWLLSSLTFPCTVMLGVWAGMLLQSNKPKLKKFLILLALGAGTLGLGWVWGNYLGPLTFPIIKHIWSSSMVLVAGGISFLLLAIFYLIIDVCRLWRWSYVFIVIGMNAIFVYMATHLWNFNDIAGVFVNGLKPWTGDGQEFVRAIAGFALVWLILLYMYRKKTFVKI